MRRYTDPATPFTDELIDALPRSGHFVYQLVGRLPGIDPFEGDAAQLYVGVTGNLRARLRAHSRKWWWVVVDYSLCAFDDHSQTRVEAEQLERDMIRMFQPAMNRAGRLLVVT